MAAMPSIIAGFIPTCIQICIILWVAFSPVFGTIVLNHPEENQEHPAKLKSNTALMQYLHFVHLHFVIIIVTVQPCEGFAMP
jgi:hypothetical protein